jgi:hypothetical protein
MEALMAYGFLDDGGHEAEDDSSIYFLFDASDPETFRNIQNILRCEDVRDPAGGDWLVRICRASLAVESINVKGSAPSGRFRNSSSGSLIRRVCGCLRAIFTRANLAQRGSRALARRERPSPLMGC